MSKSIVIEMSDASRIHIPVTGNSSLVFDRFGNPSLRKSVPTGAPENSTGAQTYEKKGINATQANHDTPEIRERINGTGIFPPGSYIHAVWVNGVQIEVDGMCNSFSTAKDLKLRWHAGFGWRIGRFSDNNDHNSTAGSANVGLLPVPTEAGAVTIDSIKVVYEVPTVLRLQLDTASATTEHGGGQVRISSGLIPDDTFVMGAIISGAPESHSLRHPFSASGNRLAVARSTSGTLFIQRQSGTGYIYSPYDLVAVTGSGVGLPDSIDLLTVPAVKPQINAVLSMALTAAWSKSLIPVFGSVSTGLPLNIRIRSVVVNSSSAAFVGTQNLSLRFLQLRLIGSMVYLCRTARPTHGTLAEDEIQTLQPPITHIQSLWETSGQGDAKDLNVAIHVGIEGERGGLRDL